MDKETLSNYGWIVICVLVLAVMIALASPFGSYVASAVENTTQGLFDVEQNALDAAGITIADQSFEGGSDTTAPDPALNPDDGTEPQAGDIYTYGDYEYCYGYGWCNLCESYTCGCMDIFNGWNVRVLDDTKTEYGAILESINGQPITNMTYTFYKCYSLTTAPTIPSSVTSMSGTFADCTALTTAPVIPSSVTSLYDTFYGCTSLTTAPVIPSSVTDMSGTFAECTALTTAPVIPNSVTDMDYTFFCCTSLTGNIEINANPTGYEDCFVFTNKSITLSGTSTLLAEIAATATNGNVKVAE